MLSERDEGFMARKKLNHSGYSDEDGSSDNIDRTTNSNSSRVRHEGRNPITKKYGIGAKLLAKMGYVEGQGLGKDGGGIAVPIQVEQRAMPNVGLGMLTDTKRGLDETYSSSEEENYDSSIHKAVSFKRTTTELMPESDKNSDADFQRQLKYLIGDLQSKLGLEIPPGIHDWIDVASINHKGEIKRLASALLTGHERILNIDHRIEALKNQMADINQEEGLLKDIQASLGSNEELPLMDEAARILSLSDPELVDKLIFELLRHRFIIPNSQAIVQVSENSLQELVELVETLKYQMDTSSFRLNRTQTIIYRIVFGQLLDRLENFKVDKHQIYSMISLILDYEPILKFINCMEYVTEKFIYFKVFEALKSWDVAGINNFPPRLWVFDFMVITDQQTRQKMEEQIAKKLQEYCSSWYHRKSAVISKPDLVFMHEILGKRFDEIIRKVFLARFIEQLWEKHFDPIMELENWKTMALEEGSIYYSRKLLEYKHYFNEEVYNKLLKGLFNEYNKILYQWLLYCDDEDSQKAKCWFSWLMNEMFQGHTPVEVELCQIRKTLNFLSSWDNGMKEPIHDETFSLIRELDIEQDENTKPDNFEPYNIQNIPMRKVIPTFKNVLEDFCEEHGYVLERLQEKFAQLPYGRHNETLAPVFKIHRGKSSQLVAMKDDILWVEREKGNFVPTYLYELE